MGQLRRNKNEAQYVLREKKGHPKMPFFGLA